VTWWAGTRGPTVPSMQRNGRSLRPPGPAATVAARFLRSSSASSPKKDRASRWLNRLLASPGRTRNFDDDKALELVPRAVGERRPSGSWANCSSEDQRSTKGGGVQALTRGRAGPRRHAGPPRQIAVARRDPSRRRGTAWPTPCPRAGQLPGPARCGFGP